MTFKGVVVLQLFSCTLILPPIAVGGVPDGYEYLEKIQCPGGLVPATNSQPVVVAIVDDGARLTHEQVRPYLWKNPGEVPGNRIDDDGNGWIDDVHGWDVADEDSHLLPPRHRQNTLYHGTHLASIITRMAQTAYGARATRRIQLMTVKCISDSSESRYLMKAYRGIEYALDQGADIILCSWGVEHISREETELLDRVQKQGVLLIASAGNLPEEREQYPAAHPCALTVSGLDATGRKMTQASFGTFVDLMALGEEISGADVRDDHAFTLRTGTSFSAAMVAGAAAILKSQNPEYSRDEIKACLMNSATPVQPSTLNEYARLGAGKLNLKNALSNGFSLPESGSDTPLHSTKGLLPLQEGPPQSWVIHPGGSLKGFRFRSASSGNSLTGILKLYKKMDRTDRPIIKKWFAGMDRRFYLPGAIACITFEPGSECPPAAHAFLAYTAEPINLSTLYCSGTQYVESEGLLEDGSGPHSYSPLTDGKWLITAPPGKVIHFKFTQFQIS